MGVGTSPAQRGGHPRPRTGVRWHAPASSRTGGEGSHPGWVSNHRVRGVRSGGVGVKECPSARCAGRPPKWTRPWDLPRGSLSARPRDSHERRRIYTWRPLISTPLVLLRQRPQEAAAACTTTRGLRPSSFRILPNCFGRARARPRLHGDSVLNRVGHGGGLGPPTPASDTRGGRQFAPGLCEVQPSTASVATPFGWPRPLSSKAGGGRLPLVSAAPTCMLGGTQQIPNSTGSVPHGHVDDRSTPKGAKRGRWASAACHEAGYFPISSRRSALYGAMKSGALPK